MLQFVIPAAAIPCLAKFKAPPAAQEVPSYSSVAVKFPTGGDTPPKANAAVCVPAPAEPC
jgi:hypothetical protein